MHLLMKTRSRRAIVMVQGIMLAGLVAVALSGCSTPAPVPAPIIETRIQVERVTIPAALLTCEAEPALGPWNLQSQVADYIVRLHEAWADCSNTVASIAQVESSAPPAPAPAPVAAK